jgi:2,3-bisphosphoglycerate-independent phosphoglycerate mutase
VAATEAAVRPLTVWPWGLLGEDRTWPALPELLRRPVTLVSPGGVVAGIGRLLGCTVVEAAPARAAAVVAGAGHGAVVVVHDPAPDDAGHARDRAGKVRAIESFDRDVIGPVAELLAARGGRLLVCPDHSCDPATGRHGRGTVPGLVWASSALGGPASSGPSRLSERAVAGRPAVPAAGLLAGQLARPEEAA